MWNFDPQPRIHDRDLLERVQSPDVEVAKDAFTEIWQRYYAPLQACVSRHLGDRGADADEVLGQLACSFWQRLRTLPPLQLTASSLWPYLRRAAHNHVVSHLTRSATSPGDVSLEALIEHDPEALLDTQSEAPNDEAWLWAYSLLLSQHAQASHVLPEKIGISSQQMSAEQARASAWIEEYSATCIMQALRQLAPTDRDVVILRCIFHLSSKDVYDVLGLTVSAVDQRYWRAKQQLRDIYISLLSDQGFSVVQIWQLLMEFERPSSSLDNAAMDDRSRAAYVRALIASGDKLRGKAKE